MAHMSYVVFCNFGYAHLIPDSLEIYNSQRWQSPCKPFAVPFFFPYRVSHERQIFQPFQLFQWLQVTQLRNIIIRENQSRKIGDG